jgi:hypothetical protein
MLFLLLTAHVLTVILLAQPALEELILNALFATLQLMHYGLAQQSAD